jgi:hypothetical protein
LKTKPRYIPFLVGTLWLGCSAPPSLELADPEETGPPPPAAASCTPPFLNDIGQTMFLFADDNLGVTCRVFLEQDACVVAIFRDCADPTPGEWQGRIDEDRLTFCPVAPVGGSSSLDSADCCTGSIETPPGDAVWSSLKCASTQDSERHSTYLEEEVDTEPFVAPSSPLAVSPADTSVVVDFTQLKTDPQQVFLTIRNPGIPARSGVYRGTVEGGNAIRIDNLSNSLSQPSVIRSSPIDNALFIVDGTAVHKVPADTLSVSVASSRTNTIDHLDVSAQWVIAAETSASGTSSLNVYEADSLSHRSSVSSDAEITAVFAPSTSYIAVATLKDQAEVLTIDPLFASRTLFLPTVPTASVLISGTRLAVAGPCGASTNSTVCYFEVDLDQTPPEIIARISVLDVRSVTSLSYRLDADEVVAVGDNGLLVQIVRSEARAKLGNRKLAETTFTRSEAGLRFLALSAQPSSGLAIFRWIER